MVLPANVASFGAGWRASRSDSLQGLMSVVGIMVLFLNFNAKDQRGKEAKLRWKNDNAVFPLILRFFAPLR